MNKVNPDKCYILLKNCVVFPRDTGSGSQKTLHQKSLPPLLSSLHECYTNLIVLQCSSYLQKQKKISTERASTIIICMQQLLMIQPYRFLTSKL